MSMGDCGKARGDVGALGRRSTTQQEEEGPEQ